MRGLGFPTAVLTSALTALASCAGSGNATSDSCRIDSQVVPAGTPNPTNGCQSCQPALDPRSWSSASPGQPCADGGVCWSGTCRRGCVLASEFFPEGAWDPDLSCQTCQPDVATLSFSPFTGLTAAGQCDPDELCISGNCQAACLIEGSVVAPQAGDPANPCAACVPALRNDAYSLQEDGTPCGNGATCVSGTCAAVCLIEGQVWSAGETNPSNPCLTCDPATSVRTWLPISGLALDGGCGPGQVCGSGSCRAGCFVDGGYLPDLASDPTNACRVCDPLNSMDDWSLLDGVPPRPCGDGGVCDQGTCRLGCFIDGGFVSNRAYRPDLASACCNGPLSPGAWVDTFGPPIPGFRIDGRTGIAVGDFDGDGRPDLLVGSGILLGAGDGTFSAAPVVGGLAPDLAGAPFSIGDFNDDGLPDLVFIDGEPPGVLLNLGWDAGFGPEDLLPSFHPVTLLLVADLNGDRVSDLLTIEPGYYPEVWLAIGDGGFARAKPVLGVLGPIVGAATADLNGDGVSDLAVILTPPDAGANLVLVLLNDGTGKFGAPTTVAGLSNSPFALATGDFNGDGKLDLAIATGQEWDLVTGDGQGAFSSPTVIAPLSSSTLVAADFNGDGALDVILPSAQGTFLVANRGDGTFYEPALIRSDQSPGLVAADFNSDGAPDLALLLNDPLWSTVVVQLGGCP